MNPFGNNTALIGHTGFVGSNLAAQASYSACYNSKNIADIEGQSFDTIVCAGVQAVKYWANQHPEEDWAKIESLLGPLHGAKAKRFILISTIDVYPKPIDVTEDDAAPAENHAYGSHRLRVEQFIAERFPVHHIARLPGLFGAGLKKNVIYDLLHDNCLEMIQKESAFQYYNLAHLTDDLNVMVKNGVSLANFATGPVKTQTIIESFAPDKVVGAKAGPPGRYDFKTKHSALWNRADGYLYSSEQVLAEMGQFMAAERAKQP